MIFRLQRRTDLAMSALRHLDGASGNRLSGPHLAELMGTSPTFLPQVMAPLIRSGWVASERGPGGGYSLTSESAGVSLLDVLEATEGPAVDGRCVLRDAPCPGDHTCPVHMVASEAREVLLDGFRQISAIPSTQGAQS